MPRPTALINLLPPVVLRKRRQWLGRERGYSSYGAAHEACGEGYDSDLLASVVARKTLRVKLQGLGHFPGTDYRVFAALAFSLGDWERRGGIRVLDFGGGAGAHYLSARSLISPHIQLNWSVVETPAMVKAAAPLASVELSFHDSIPAAVDRLKHVPDLVFVSSVLHYVPSPTETLRDLAALGSKCLVVTRTGLSSDQQWRYAVQHSSLATNGPGPLPEGERDRPIRYPVTFMPRQTLETELLNSGYTVAACNREDPAVWSVDGTLVDHWGYFCRLSPSDSADRGGVQHDG